MSNSLVHSLEGYVRALFQDIAPTYGSNHDWERDLKRSLHELAIRGERFLTIDLPALRKHLEKCLEEGLYTRSNLYLSGMVSKRVQVPAFGRDLYLQIFDKQGKLLSEPNPFAVADLRQLYEGFGKLKHPCKQEAIDEEVANFLTIEESLRKPSLLWENDTLFERVDSPSSISFDDGFDHHLRDGQGSLLDLAPGYSPGFSRGDARTFQQVCDIVSSSFGDLHLERDDELVSERPQHGTGRVSNLRKEVSKYSFSDWPTKLDRIFPYDWYATSDLGQMAYQDNNGSLGYRNHEHPSKLIAVPKTMSGPRLIGSEPNYHQWIQQLIRSQLEHRIKATPLRKCVSFGNQEPNRQMALQSSVDHSMATVDLKSASDRLSCWTIERALRANITMLERIHASRTRMMTNAINDHFHKIILRKCFTQGSACTFPVQTIVYSMIAIASVLITENRRVTTSSITHAATRVRVFGDDIIVPKQALPKLIEILSFLQLSVNLNKTFWKGSFRESCGLDAFMGVDVTPARVKRFSTNPSHEIAQSMLESCNNFHRRGMWHVASWLQSYLRKYNFQIVPIHDSDGLASYCGAHSSHLQKRWNDRLHRYEIRVSFLVSNSKKVPTQSAHDLLEYLSSRKGVTVKLPHLSALQSGLGVVNKKSSVMRTGWRPLISN
jgi:hypothetical protein